jgi:hypothetical protein
MKRGFLILFSFLYLYTHTEFYQFLKIPILIEHFYAHTSQNPALSFWDFMVLHYDHHTQDADWKKDKQLPFIDHINFLTVYYTIERTFSLEEQNLTFILPHSKILVQNEKLNEWEIIHSIWQPPPFEMM